MLTSDRTTLLFNRAAWALFIPLMEYILLRAWFVEPLHDETATFYHYIETGAIFDNALLDANNHLLNSAFGRCMYLLFGEHFFGFRLLNVAGFAAYFRGCYLLATEQRTFSQRLLLLLALVTIPYITDYFAYTRGYGAALACFTWGFILLKKWISSPSVRLLAGVYFLLFLAVCSSLTYLVSACLGFAFILFFQAAHFRKITIKKHLVFTALHGLFMLGMVPLIYFSFLLKNGGALYYGSLDGFWNVTGKSLSKVILFYNEDWLKTVICVVGVLFIGFLILRAFRVGFWQQLKRTESVTAYFILGNALAILFLAKVMQVNYPEDRAGMFFLPLAIIAFANTVFQARISAWSGWLLLFFPVTFIWNLNLSTSVFTPDERMNTAFFEQVNRALKPGMTVSVYPTMQLNWALNQKHSSGQKYQANAMRDFTATSDVILTKTVLTAKSDLSGYRVIASYPPSGYIAYMRKKPAVKTLLLDTLAADHASNGEFIPLYSGPIPGEGLLSLQLDIKGTIATDTCFQTLDLVIATFDETGAIVEYNYHNLRWYFGEHNRAFPIRFNASKQRTASEKEIRIYIWNPQHANAVLKKGSIQFYKLEN